MSHVARFLRAVVDDPLFAFGLVVLILVVVLTS